MQTSFFQPRFTAGRALLACTAGLVGFVCATLSVSAHASASDDQAQIKDINDANNNFAFDFLGQGVKQGENLIFSPYGVSECFGMLYAGSTGKTEKMLAELFNFPLPPGETMVSFGKLREVLAPRQQVKGCKIKLGNSIWASINNPFRVSYVELVKAFLGADARTVDFTLTTEVTAEMDGWVEENTEGMITKAPGNIEPQDLMVLMNTIMLDAEWKSPFNSSATAGYPFELAQGELVETPFMRQTSYYGYLKKDGVQVFEMPYAGNMASMTVIVPDEGRDIADIEKMLSPERIDSWHDAMKSTRLSLSMPKFEFQASLDLIPIITEMSSADLFANPQLGGMLENVSVMISEALQDAVIKVDEKGTKAAAVTKIKGTRSAVNREEPTRLIVNRPFFFLVRDREMGTIYFMGRVMDPRG